MAELQRIYSGEFLLNLSLYKDELSNGENISFDGLEAMRVFSSFGVVFLHVCSATGTTDFLELCVKFRDFALPVMVLSSFFVLTVSLRRKADSERDFGDFFCRLVNRLFLPFFVWTGFYVLFIVVFVPLMMGETPSIDSFTTLVFLTGYRHLWYLQFLFAGSVIAYPFILRALNHCRISAAKILFFGSGISIFYACFYHLVFRHQIRQMLASESDINLQIFVEQTSRYILFIPLAIGLGLTSGTIIELFKKKFCRRISLLLVILVMLLHVRTLSSAASQEFYGLVVFLAALQPWKKISYRFWQKLVEQSYGIYILHFFWVHILWLFIAYYNPEINITMVLSAVFIIYLLSFTSALLVRKIFPVDWLMPFAGKQASKSSHLQILRLSLAGEK